MCSSMKPVGVDVLLVVAATVLADSQSLPQFKSGANILKNNSYIPIGSIGVGDKVLKCETDSTNCCNDFKNLIANWRDERGRAVPNYEPTCLHVTRGQGVVSLNRRRDCIPDTSGLWRCDIPDSSEVMQSLYIYISNNESYGNAIITAI